MANPRLTPAQEAELQKRLQAHPGYQAALAEPHYRYRSERIGKLTDEILATMGLGSMTDSYHGTAFDGADYNPGPNWGQIAALLSVPAGAAAVASLFGGGAAAGAGGAASEAGPASQALGMQGLAPSATMGGPGAASLAGAIGSGASAAGGFPWADVLKVAAPAGVSLAGKALSNNANGAPIQGGMELNELLQLAMERMRAQQPLFEATNKQAYEGLPMYAKGK